MRRALPVIFSTVAAMALLAGFHTTASIPPSSSDPTRATTPPGASPPDKARRVASAPVRRTIDGQAVLTKFGYVQVEAVVQGSRLLDVRALELPSSHVRSQQISDRVAPWLHDEAIQAQSANVDVISGATYTSEGYRRSLQSALDRASIS